MSVVPYTLTSYQNLVRQYTRQGRNPLIQQRDIKRSYDEIAKATTEYQLQKRKLKEKYDAVDYKIHAAELLESFRKKRRHLRDKADEQVRRELEKCLGKLATSLQSDSIRFWGITPTRKVNGRQICKIDSSPEITMAAIQACTVLRKSLRGRIQSRTYIVRCLKTQLERDLGIGIIRTDIKSFYDSIPHKELKALLAHDNDVDAVTKTLLIKFIEEYAAGFNVVCGLPTGVNLSAYLAEYYLSDFDDYYRLNNDIYFYGRFVDDMVLITRPEAKLETVFEDLKDRLSSKGLSIHEPTGGRGAKSVQIKLVDGGLVDPNSQAEFEYLGYRIDLRQQDEIVIDLSDSRKAKLRRRVTKAFAAHRRSCRSDPRRALKYDRLLLKRIELLAGNYSLSYPKNYVKTGIYFSNSEITDSKKTFKDLQTHLLRLTKQRLAEISGGLQAERFEILEKLLSVEFDVGFETKRFYCYKRKTLTQLTRIWY